METNHIEAGFPLYKQLIERIKYYLLSGKLQIEQKLAPPKVLAEKIGINKNTIITAYKQLEAEGLLVTKNGQGTFVASIPASWQDQTASRQLVELAQESQTKALQLGFTLEDWYTVVFNQTILEKTIPAGISLDWEFQLKEPPTHMLFVTDSHEPLTNIAKELNSYFMFHLPVKVCTLSALKSELNDDLVTKAYAIYSLFSMVKEVDEILKPCGKTVIGLPNWMRAEYPF